MSAPLDDAGSKAVRRDQKRADFLLRYRRDVLLAVVAANKIDKPPGMGMQQVKDYADILGVPTIATRVEDDTWRRT